MVQNQNKEPNDTLGRIPTARKKLHIFDETSHRHPLLPVAICALLGLTFLGVLSLLAWYGASSMVKWSLLFACLYFAVCGTFTCIWVFRDRRIAKREREMALINKHIGDVFKDDANVPYALISSHGVIKVVNHAMQKLLRFSSPICNIPLSEISDLPLDTLIASAAKVEEISQKHPDPGKSSLPMLSLEGRTFELTPYAIRFSEHDVYYLTLFNDVTAFVDLSEQYKREDLVVAFIALDNLEEVAQYVRANLHSATGEVEKLLKDFATELNGFLQEFDHDRFLLLCNRQSLETCVAHGFDILESVRQVKVGDNSFPLTISMGISAVGGSIREKEEAASSALDIALQRGGDQVVLRRADGLSYFGGRIKPMQSNSSIMSRVNAQHFAQLVQEADNVLIMGHRNPDYDAIASCIGLAKFALCAAEGKQIDINVVVNTNDANFRVVSPLIDAIPDADTLFVDKEKGLDLVRSGTLLVVADANSMKVVEAPDIVTGVTRVVIIDHHRQVDEFGFTPALTYIHPTASSASELVSEMFEQSQWSDQLSREEANLLLTGMMLDTKNFTHNTGAQTFQAVHYLYSRRAHTNVARLFFRDDIRERNIVSDLGAHAKIYYDRYAISHLTVDHEITTADRIAASKAADSLLTIQGVDASFVLIKCRGVVIVSARSQDKVNVQLIVEKLGGGGHFDMAGAQMAGVTLDEAVDKLLSSIKTYDEQNHIN